MRVTHRLFALGQITVDVVALDGLALRRGARLTGTQQNADQPVAELLPNGANGLEPGVLVLHDHIKQHHADIGLLPQALDGLPSRLGADEFYWFCTVNQIAQTQTSNGMNVGLVVGNEDFPASGHHDRGHHGEEATPATSHLVISPVAERLSAVTQRASLLLLCRPKFGSKSE